MENLDLHSPEAARCEPTQFSERETFNDGENLKRQNEISLNAELNFSIFAKRISDDVPIELSPFQRARHVYIVGATGSGKSTALERVVINDINSGIPTLFLDPHGESAYRVMDSIKRTRKICYFDLSQPSPVVRYNIMADVPTDNAAKAANDIIAAVKDIFFPRDFNAPRFTHYLRHHLIPLIEKRDCTLLDLLRMLSDSDYRERITTDVRDPLSALFWEPKTGEYAKAGKKYNAEAVAPIANKLSQILSTPNLRNVLASRKPTLSLAAAFKAGYSVVVNLAKGQIGADAAFFMGSLLVSDANNVLMASGTVDKPVAITADEFQNFAIDIIASMLSEIRKKGGMLTLAHQFTSQIDEYIFDAIMANAGTVVSFRVSPKDATLLAPQLDTNPQRPLSQHLLTQLAPFEAHMRSLNEDREHIQSLPPLATTGRAAKLITESNARFARKVSDR
jgi:DNA helicase HerA-like ATPase